MYEFCESKTYEFNRVGIAICVISILFMSFEVVTYETMRWK